MAAVCLLPKFLGLALFITWQMWQSRLVADDLERRRQAASEILVMTICFLHCGSGDHQCTDGGIRGSDWLNSADQVRTRMP